MQDLLLMLLDEFIKSSNSTDGSTILEFIGWAQEYLHQNPPTNIRYSDVGMCLQMADGRVVSILTKKFVPELKDTSVPITNKNAYDFGAYAIDTSKPVMGTR